MGVKWTEEQQKVINLRNRNILVSAAAGSGKNGSFGRAYYTNADRREASDRCGPSVDRDIYRGGGR